MKWQNPSGKTQIPCHFATSPLQPSTTAPCAAAWGFSHRKEQPMNNETSKTSAPAAASPLTAKPDLVKNIGGTTFDIHIHFSETSLSAKPAGKPLRTRLCALSRTTAAMKPLKSKILFSCSLLTKPERHHPERGRSPAGAQGIPHQKPKSYQLQEVHEI